MKMSKLGIGALVAVAGLTVSLIGSLAWARGETCEVLSVTGIRCSVASVTRSKGLVSFETVASGFVRPGIAHDFVFHDPTEGDFSFQIPPGTNEGCTAVTSNFDECPGSCSCYSDSCSCHGSVDFVYCEWWIQNPNGEWEVWGEGTVC